MKFIKINSRYDLSPLHVIGIGLWDDDTYSKRYIVKIEIQNGSTKCYEFCNFEEADKFRQDLLTQISDLKLI